MVTEKEELLRHVLEKARRKCKISPPVYAQRL
jgi:hypothetical protein